MIIHTMTKCTMLTTFHIIYYVLVNSACLNECNYIEYYSNILKIQAIYIPISPELPLLGGYGPCTIRVT